MSQDDFYKPSYYGQSHSTPTTEKWFDSVQQTGGSSAVEGPALIEPIRPLPIAQGIDPGYLPPSATIVPYNPTGSLDEWKERWE